MPETDDINRPFFARMYERCSRTAEERGEGALRRELLDTIAGEVIEVGCGNGLNFSYYPSSVGRVLAVEPEPNLRASALQAAVAAPAPIEVVEGMAERLPAADSSFDAAVVSLVLCSVAEQSAALKEINRVLRPSGELRFYEHVVSNRPVMRALQRFGDATFWPKIAGGCHAARDTLAAIEQAGFEVEQVRRFPFKGSAVLPSVPHILGVARAP